MIFSDDLTAFRIWANYSVGSSGPARLPDRIRLKGDRIFNFPGFPAPAALQFEDLLAKLLPYK
jgi:hypothetical protein